jgi:hypothetical protein
VEQRRDSCGNRKENIFVLGVQGKRIRKSSLRSEERRVGQDIRWRIQTITTLFWIERRDITTQLTASSKIIPNCHSWSLL